MHYYKRHIGDYHTKAARLTILQHGIYTLLMDAIYDREKFPTKEEAIDWLWVQTEEEIAALDFVLLKFFDDVDGVYYQSRIEDEIISYQEKCTKNAQIAKDREDKRKSERTKRDDTSTKRAPVVYESPPNQEPLTNNHKPITINTYAAAMPCKDGEYYLQNELLITFEQTYKNINVPRELDKARAWLLSNPNKQKTKRGCSKFLNGWLARAKPEQLNNKTQEQDFVSLHTDIEWSKDL